MIILLSLEETFEKETTLVNQLFESGLHLFHIRKYMFNDSDMKKYIHEIDVHFRNRLVLHSHRYLAADYGIKRVHFKEEDRLQNRQLPFQDMHILSTSVHTVNEFNSLDAVWSYAFFSPVFPSISKKGYGVHKNVLKDVKDKKNPNVQMIALGGIDENNCQTAKIAGADGIALMGSIWYSKNPLQTFLACRHKDL